MSAELLHREKRIVFSKKKTGIAELKIWKVPIDKNYAHGVKYSLFLVCEGEVIIGFDNHKPKGPHLHYQGKEIPYNYVDEDKLLEDFWDLVHQEGFTSEA